MGGWREREEREREEREVREGGVRREKREERRGIAEKMSITRKRVQRELNWSEVDGKVTGSDFKQIFCQNVCRQSGRIATL